MNVEIVTSLCIFFLQDVLFLKIQANDICYYLNYNGTRISISCNGGCCPYTAITPEAACCATLSWGTIAIPFFVITGVCILAVCFIYCRPVCKPCCRCIKCPCAKRRRVASPPSVPPNVNPVYILDNDDLPDYETTIKDPIGKEGIPPPYNFVTEHPTDFGIEGRVPSAPPQYQSRRSSLVTTNP